MSVSYPYELHIYRVNEVDLTRPPECLSANTALNCRVQKSSDCKILVEAHMLCGLSQVSYTLSGRSMLLVDRT
jgi:hypothetical protein